MQPQCEVAPILERILSLKINNMEKTAQQVEFLKNGTTITNLLTGDKEGSYNSAKSADNAKEFIIQQLANAEAGEYYDIHISVTKQRNKKPVGK